MNRIMIIGCGGSGKSTLARKLGALFNLPVVHLDKVYWQPGWLPLESGKFKELLLKAVLEERWIIDGNYSNFIEPRLERAELVIWLDFPRLLCLWRVLKRRVQFQGQSRPDLSQGCPEKVDAEFIHWVWNFNTRSRPRLKEKVGCYPVPVLRFTSPRQLEKWLQERMVNRDHHN